MTATTTVGMAWGMVALGIAVTPRKERVTAVQAATLTDRCGEHAAIRILSTDRQREAALALEPFGATTSSAVAMLARQRQEPLAVTQLRPLSTVDADRPSIIHAVHGVTSSDDWFLLADVGALQSSSDRVCQVGEHRDGDADGAWLVVAGGCARDMIRSDAVDPTPVLAY